MSAQHDEAPEARARALARGLEATAAADATVGRETLARERAAEPDALPMLSIEAADGTRVGTSSGRSDGAPAELQLLELLGAGGMGAVYAARQRALARDVAIKRPLSPDASPSARAALLGEARMMGALEHPNIVPVHALGCDRDGLPVLVMKRVEGVSWRELLHDEAHPMWARLGPSRARGLAFHVEVLMSVCDALRFAHSRGVVHRDVKPENVMIGAFGEVYLLDWGVARRVDAADASASVVGTPVYMAPEMLLAPSSADERTDVYLLGATLHEMLVGRPRHDGATLAEVFGSVLAPAPYVYPEGVPTELAELCAAALEPDPARRPASAGAFRDALAAHLAHRGSRDLAAAAAAKLAEVEARSEANAAALEGPDVGLLLAEARFGLEQSLRAWSENSDARRAMQRCLEASIARELRLRNASAARALLAALPEPRPALASRLAALEDELNGARAREEAQRERARQLDASVSAWPRFLLLGAVLFVGVGLSVGAYLDERRTGAPMPMGDQLRIDVTVLTLLAIALALGRRRLLANAYNRVAWSLWIITMTGMLGTDAYMATRGIDSRSATVLDFALLSAVFATGAVTFHRSLAWVALVGATTAAVSALAPTLATPTATLALVLILGFLMDQTRRSAKR